MSSCSPGPSPTNMRRAFGFPSPNTTCLQPARRRQRLQARAMRDRSSRVPKDGSGSSTTGGSVSAGGAAGADSAPETAGTAAPVWGSGSRDDGAAKGSDSCWPLTRDNSFLRASALRAYFERELPPARVPVHAGAKALGERGRRINAARSQYRGGGQQADSIREPPDRVPHRQNGEAVPAHRGETLAGCIPIEPKSKD